jgi:hypothetical protein
MIGREQLEHFAKLYELGYLNFDGISEEASAARGQLNNELWQSYEQRFPNREVAYLDFRDEITRAIKRFLRERPPVD